MSEVGHDVLDKKSERPQVKPLPKNDPPKTTRRGLFQLIIPSGVKGQEKLPAKKSTKEPKPQGLTRGEFLKLAAGSSVTSLIASSLIFGVKPWELLDVFGALGKSPDIPPQPTPPAKKEETPPPKPDVFSLVFGGLTPEEKNVAQKQVEAMRNLLANHSSYNGLLAV